MVFIYAFIIGGVLCAAGQLLSEIKQIKPPVALIICMVSGGVLSALGVMDWLNSLGGGAVCVFAAGFGNASYTAGAALVSGQFAPIITVIVVVTLLVFFGAIGGLIYVKTTEGKKGM